MIDRRFLVSGLGSAALFSVAGARPTRAAVGPLVLRLGFTGTRGAAIGTGAVVLATQVAETCGGRLRIDLYPGQEAGGETEMAQDIHSGAFDMLCSSSSGYAVYTPALGIFDIPFLFRDTTHARAVLDGPIGRKALKRLEDAGLVGLAWSENGLRHITTATKPIRNAADLAGLKIRVPQISAMITGFRAMGADAQPLPFPDLYAALASGQFQAQENPLSTIWDGKLYRVQRYLNLTGHVYSPAMFMISRRVFDTLSPEDAHALRAAAVAGGRAAREAGDTSAKTIIEDLRRHGMTIVEDIDRRSFKDALAGAQQGFAAQFGADDIAAIQTFA